MTSSHSEIHLTFVSRLIIDVAEGSDLTSNDQGYSYKFWISSSESATPELIKSQIELGDSFTWVYVVSLNNHFFEGSL